MNLLLLWDSSGLTKGYAPETGAATAEALLDMGAAMCITFPIYAETIAALLRSRNRGELTPAAFREAVAEFRQEALTDRRYRILETDSEVTLASVPLILRHNLNSSDAAILATYLAVIAEEPDTPPLSACRPRRRTFYA